MLRIAICDDELSILSFLERTILDYFQRKGDKVDVEVFPSGEDLLRFITTEHEFDLIFLDIELQVANGITVGNTIRKQYLDHLSKIVFMSSQSGYAMDLFEVQPFNFFVKPLQMEKIHGCLELVLKLSLKEAQLFEYQVSKNTKKVRCDEIIYLEVKNRQIYLVTTKGTDSFYGKITEIKEKLPNFFCLCHRSYLINFYHISEFSTKKVMMSDGSELPVGRAYETTIQNLLIDMETEKFNGNI